MGFKVKGRRISHKPNETWRYSQNRVGGGGFELKREKNQQREQQQKKGKIKELLCGSSGFFIIQFPLASFALFKYLDDDDDNLSHSTLRKKRIFPAFYYFNVSIYFCFKNLLAFVWQQQVK